MNIPVFFLARADTELQLVWEKATPEAKGIIVVLIIFSIFAWSVMASTEPKR
jgi:hypothetical protein